MAPGAAESCGANWPSTKTKRVKPSIAAGQFGTVNAVHGATGHKARLFESAKIGVAPVFIAHRGQATFQQPLQGLAPMRECGSGERLRVERRGMLGRNTGEESAAHAASLITQS